MRVLGRPLSPPSRSSAFGQAGAFPEVRVCALAARQARGGESGAARFAPIGWLRAACQEQPSRPRGGVMLTSLPLRVAGQGKISVTTSRAEKSSPLGRLHA